MSKSTISSLQADALYSKSQVYIGRGFRAQDAGDREEYQLWASLALELLGKSALATVHPALVADPNHFQSLFAACGRVLSPDVKTITAKTLFLRLSHLDKSFDMRHQTFCEQISLRRNAELHSGESPFTGMVPEAWEREFWSAAKVILEMQDESLESWLGAEKAKAPVKVVAKANEACKWAVKDTIARHKKRFEKEHVDPKKRKKAEELAEKLESWDIGKYFKEQPEGEDFVKCPACQCNAPIAGAFWDEQIIESEDPEEWSSEKVRVTYVSQEFYCPTCHLNLSGAQEVIAAGLPAEFEFEEIREREFEPEYGND